MNKIKMSIFLVAMLFATSLMAQSVDDGKKFMYYERYQSAKNVFEKLVASNPANEEAIYWLGQAEIGLDDIAGAKALYLQKLSANPNSPLILAGVGNVELLEGKTAEARNHFETAISLSQGKSIPVLNAVGSANSNPDVKNGDAAYAVSKLEQATKIKGFKDPEVLANLGDAYRKTGDGGKAIQSYQAALAINPNYARAIYRSGRVYQTQGRGQEELYIKYYNDAIAKDPAYAPVYNTLFNYYYETNVTRSAEYLEKYLSASDDDPKACYYRASMKYAQGLFQEALSKANECITAGGTTPYPNLFGIKALAYNRLNDSVNAKASYEEYFKRQLPEKIGSGDYSAYAAILLKFPGNEAAAGQLVEKAVALDTLEVNKVAYLKSLAMAYDEQKKYGEAADWYNKILSVKKNYSNVDLYNAGYGYFRSGAYDSAISVFNRYTAKYPEDIFGYYMIGKAQAGIDSTGALSLAVPAYQKAIAIGEAATDKEKVKNQLIGAYKYFIEYYYNVKKDQATALSYVDKALAIDPSDAQLISNREFISKNDPKAPPKKAPAPKAPAKKASAPVKKK
ncbi:MAG: Tetratricopeptide 1 repeat-containing protein [Ferruginibacter sp.]|nr:Tetratricopeptide 1 repeat-containing protein [Ferruginibacter sp.]